jgi:hypothetical protein
VQRMLHVNTVGGVYQGASGIALIVRGRGRASIHPPHQRFEYS